ncbi:serine hydrolase [Streptomyces sp. NPDC002054]|uniref:serine hydrolase n=1 Tax=Streptomyces sp. NPDC002054 TaxID=3154663 RepID=UPI00332F05B0
MTSAMTSDAQIPVPPGGAWAIGDSAGTRLHGTHASTAPWPPAAPGAGPAQGPDRGPAPHSGSGPGSGLRAGGRVEVAGLAAVLAVWPVLGTLVDEGALRLHTPLAAYGPTLGRATAHQLLTRTGDHDLLARLAEHVTGRSLADLAAERIWRPLAMSRTAFTPTLHTALEDTAAFLRHLLAPGSGPLSPDWIADSLRIRTGELAPSRGLLWRPAPGTDRRQDIWVHHATPGPTALWISPRHHRWAALLTPPAPHAPPHTGLRDAFRAFAFGPFE